MSLPMRPKARGLEQHDVPPGGDGSGRCDLYVIDGPYRLPIPYQLTWQELPTLSKKWAPFYVLYSGGHKCNSLWGVSLRSDVTQIWRKAPQRNRINVILRLTHHVKRKMISTGGDRSSTLRDPSLVLYHCATHTLIIASFIKLNMNIFCQVSEVA